MPDTGASTKPDLAQAMNNLQSALEDVRHAIEAKEAKDTPAPDGPVFSALRKWRTEQARAKQLPPYVIATDAVLRAIEQAKPTDLDQLQAIRGMGGNRSATYGAEILQVVATAA